MGFLTGPQPMRLGKLIDELIKLKESSFEDIPVFVQVGDGDELLVLDCVDFHIDEETDKEDKTKLIVSAEHNGALMEITLSYKDRHILSETIKSIVENRAMEYFFSDEGDLTAKQVKSGVLEEIKRMIMSVNVEDLKFEDLRFNENGKP